MTDDLLHHATQEVERLRQRKHLPDCRRFAVEMVSVIGNWTTVIIKTYVERKELPIVSFDNNIVQDIRLLVGSAKRLYCDSKDVKRGVSIAVSRALDSFYEKRILQINLSFWTPFKGHNRIYKQQIESLEADNDKLKTELSVQKGKVVFYKEMCKALKADKKQEKNNENSINRS